MQRLRTYIIILSLAILVACIAASAAAPSKKKKQAPEIDRVDQIRKSTAAILLGSFPLEKFLAEKWQSVTVKARTAAPDLLPKLFHPGVLELLVSTSRNTKDSSVPLNSSDIKMVKRTKGKDGEWWTGQVPVEDINASVVKAAYNNGFTAVMNKLNFRWQPLEQMAEVLSDQVFGYRVNINVYYTPAGSQGFEAHFDWMESFVIQVLGRKRWTLYPSLIDLPRSEQKFKPNQSELIQPTHITLNVGDVLYIPSGVMHEATTEAQAQTGADDQTQTKGAEQSPLTESMHLTIGVEIDALLTWAGLLHSVVARAETQGEIGETEADDLHAAIFTLSTLSPQGSVLRGSVPVLEPGKGFGLPIDIVRVGYTDLVSGILNASLPTASQTDSSSSSSSSSSAAAAAAAGSPRLPLRSHLIRVCRALLLGTPAVPAAEAAADDRVVAAEGEEAEQQQQPDGSASPFFSRFRVQDFADDTISPWIARACDHILSSFSSAAAAPPGIGAGTAAQAESEWQKRIQNLSRDVLLQVKPTRFALVYRGLREEAARRRKLYLATQKSFWQGERSRQDKWFAERDRVKQQQQNVKAEL